MLLFHPVFCIFQTKMNIGCDMKRFHNSRLPEVNDYTIWRQMNPVKPVHIWHGAAWYAHSSIPQFHSTLFCCVSSFIIHPLPTRRYLWMFSWDSVFTMPFKLSHINLLINRHNRNASKPDTWLRHQTGLNCFFAAFISMEHSTLFVLNTMVGKSFTRGSFRKFSRCSSQFPAKLATSFPIFSLLLKHCIWNHYTFLMLNAWDFVMFKCKWNTEHISPFHYKIWVLTGRQNFSSLTET